MAPTLSIRLFGDFGLTDDDEPVTGINTPRLQSLLAYLVLHRDTPQLRQRLAFLFWPDSTEAQARNNLRQTLHALRLALPSASSFLATDTNILHWRPDGPFHLDVAAFERALARAEQAGHPANADERVPALEQAVALYRGDLLPTCYDEWIGPERERLRQHYLTALDQLIQLLEGRRDFPAAIGYARQLIQHDAVNEDAYRTLMRLLVRTGDRAGALRAYHACVTVLQRELGLSPGKATREAYERLMRTEDQEDATAAPSRTTLAATPTFIGRQREWQHMHDAWDRACSGVPLLALVTGEAGIGKSRLAEELHNWIEQSGAATTKAHCYAAEGRLSLAPVTEWLRDEGVRPHLERLDPLWLAEVARILPELSSERPDLPRYEPITEYGQRQRFFEALARAVLAAPQPLLLCLDDMHWCDQETLEWLHFLLRFSATARILVLGTARIEEIVEQHPLRALLLQLRNTNGVVEVPLQPLDAAETAKLAAAIAQHEMDVATALYLHRETEGNPLFVVETMRAGFDSSPQTTVQLLGNFDMSPPSGNHALPPRVQAVIAGRLAQLSTPAHELAALAATIGREFQVDVLTHAGTGDEDAIVRTLDELWRRRIVREHGADTYDFTHDKLREVAYAEIGAPQRRLLHRRIGRALEEINASDLDLVSGQIAAHYERAGMAEQAIPYFQRAAAVAQRIYANEDAIALLSSALALLERLPGGARRDARELSVLLALAPILRVTRGWTAPELERVVDRTLALCDTIGDDRQRAEALFGLQSLLVVQGKLERVQLVGEQLRALDERIGRAEQPLSTVMVAGTRLHLGHFAEANDTFELLVATHDPQRPPDVPDILGWNYAVLAFAWQAHALWCMGYPERAMSQGSEAIHLAQELQLPFNQALAAAYLAMLRQMCADPTEAKEQAETALAFTIEFKAPYYRAWASIMVAYAAALDQPDAPHLAGLRAAIEELKASGARLRMPYYLWLLARAQAQAGRAEEGLETIDEALAESRASNERWWDAELHRERGELLRTCGRDVYDVETALLRAAEIASAQQARSLELRAAMSLARLWRQRDRAGEARHLLESVYAWFTEGFDTPDLRAARALLDGLG